MSGSGVPGVWIKEIDSAGDVRVELVPTSGKIASILTPARSITLDPREEKCRKENADDLP